MKKNKSANLLVEIFLWVCSIVTIYPLLMVVLTAFKTRGEASYLNIKFPKVWQFSNFAEVWKYNFLRFLGNSVFTTFVAVLLTLVLSAVMSFVLTRRNTRGCRTAYRLMTFGIIAPFAAMPTIKLLRGLGLYGSHIGLSLCYAALFMPFTTMIFTGFIKGIPRELDEAAVIDGVRGFSLFGLIISPLLKPVIATAGVLNFMWVWNELQIPIYLLNSSSKWTLPLSVYNFYGQYSRSWNLVCADMVMVSVPVVLVYIFAQRYIINGMISGAVKG
ncbi:MAG: carbohydrate ABC transporter permease [Treponema sp.]|jgi:raffinose/stachyose/melibiose transport system permease protein|nr:carbohydrate ABC transporter permease [Treponema sp.]